MIGQSLTLSTIWSPILYKIYAKTILSILKIGSINSKMPSDSKTTLCSSSTSKCSKSDLPIQTYTKINKIGFLSLTNKRCFSCSID